SASTSMSAGRPVHGSILQKQVRSARNGRERSDLCLSPREMILEGLAQRGLARSLPPDPSRRGFLLIDRLLEGLQPSGRRERRRRVLRAATRQDDRANDQDEGGGGPP